MIINNLFNIGDFVKSNTDEESRRLIITEIIVSKGGLMYRVSHFDNERVFWEFELDKWVGADREPLKDGFITLSIEYLKGLTCGEYKELLSKNREVIVEEILTMLVEGEEFEMAEVTKRYINRIKTN